MNEYAFAVRAGRLGYYYTHVAIQDNLLRQFRGHSCLLSCMFSRLVRLQWHKCMCCRQYKIGRHTDSQIRRISFHLGYTYGGSNGSLAIATIFFVNAQKTAAIKREQHCCCSRACCNFTIGEVTELAKATVQRNKHHCEDNQLSSFADRWGRLLHCSCCSCRSGRLESARQGMF